MWLRGAIEQSKQPIGALLQPCGQLTEYHRSITLTGQTSKITRVSNTGRHLTETLNGKVHISIT